LLLRRNIRRVEREITQIYVADLRLPIPTKHGVDSLGEFCTARLVNATRIDPGIAVSIAPSLLAGCRNLAVPCLARGLVVLGFTQLREFWEGHLAICPGVRKDSVRRDVVAVEQL